MSCDRFLLVLLACLLIAPAVAAESGSSQDDPFTRPGVYFGVGSALIVQLWEDELDDAIGGDISIDKGVGFNGVLGYRFMPNFAAEIYYEAVKGYNVNLNGSRFFRVDSHVFSANTRIYLPFKRVQPYLLLGIGMAHFDIHDRFSVKGGTINVGGRLGAGVDFYLTENIVLNASFSSLLSGFELEVPGQKNVDGLFYLSTQLGVAYRF